jgi:hypothetical protein
MGFLVMFAVFLLLQGCAAVTIAVSGLNPKTTDAILHEIFSQFGVVDAAYVHPGGRGTGTVLMPDVAAANRAASRLVSFTATVLRSSPPGPAVVPRVVPPGAASGGAGTTTSRRGRQ